MQLTEMIEAVPADSKDLAGMVMNTFADLTLSKLEQLPEIYAEDVCFEDPIHGIQGLDALQRYFETLMRNVEQCRFKFHRSVISNDGIFLSWTMMVRHKALNRGQVTRVEGSSYLKYRDGKVYYHRDYFDLGAMVYEHVPLIGPVIRYIRGRLAR